VGPVFWDKTIGEVCRAPGTRVQVALQEVLEKELVFERQTSTFTGAKEYMFAQSAVREVSYDKTSTGERSKYHARIAQWLLAHSDEQVSEHLGLIADHLEKAGQKEAAIHYLRRAGEQATARFANAQALTYFNRAIILTTPQAYAQRYNLRLACDNIYDLESKREQQAENLADLAVLAEVLEDNQRRAEVTLRRANHALMTGDYPTAITTVQTAIKLAQTIGEPKIESKGFLHWGQALWYQGDYPAAQVQLKQALTLASNLPEIETQCHRDLGTVSYLKGDYAGATNYYQQSLELCRQIDSRQGESSALNGLGIVAEHQGDFLESKFYHEQSLHICREIGFRQGEGNALVDLGNVYLGWGDYEAAQKYYEQALEVYREIDDRQGEGLVLGNFSLLFHQTGDDETACEYSRQALDIAREIGDRSGEGFVFTGLGHAYAALGNLAEASESYQEALVVRRELKEQNLIMETLAGLARISLKQNNLDRALAFVEEILAHLDRFPQDSGHQGLDGTEEPFRIYLTCYQVLKANQDPRAQEILNTAHMLLQDQATRLDPDLRRSFLENVVAHREILAAWLVEEGG
jgi:tetratricopeptide (TPR) repeat protein